MRSTNERPIGSAADSSGSTIPSPTPATLARFVERANCPSCRAERCDVAWSGRFSDEDVAAFLADFHYGADTKRLLGDAEFALVRCRACDFVFHRRILDERWMAKLYAEWIDRAQVEAFEGTLGREATRRLRFEQARQEIKHLLRIRHLLEGRVDGAIRVLDFGCGEGRFLALADLLAFEGYGIDASVTRLAQGADRGVRIFPDFASYDAVADGPAHAITLFQVLEHLADPRGVLEALRERLADDGVLVVEVPDCRGIERPRTFDEFHAVQPLEHVNAFTPESLRALCERAGFAPLPRIPAHVGTHVLEVLATEASRFVARPRTSIYLRKARTRA